MNDNALTLAVEPLQKKAERIYEYFTIPINTCYDMYYKRFDEHARKYFSELISEIDVVPDQTSQGGLILRLGAPGIRFKSVDTPFCSALKGFYQLIIDIKTHFNNIGRVKIKYKRLLHGGLEARTGECVDTPGSYPGGIIAMRNDAMRDDAMSEGGSKSRRRHRHKHPRKTRHKRAHRSRAARKHKKYSRRR
jgi:hypothetical protein